jgi:uncharacterized protein YggE
MVTHWAATLTRIRDLEIPMRHWLPVVCMSLLAGMAAPVLADDSKPGTIAIDGRGEVVSAPDTASVNAGVETEAQTARGALTANTTAMTALIAALKAAGVEPKDIQTAGFSVSPEYVYPDRDNNSGATPPPRITGYQVHNGVNVKVRKLDTLGTILDQIVSVGANTINAVDFSVADPARLLDEARKAAFVDAEAKAKIYTEAAGIGLGRVLSISENAGEPAPRPMALRAMAAPMAGAAVPVEAGQLTFDVDVSVQWELKAPAS